MEKADSCDVVVIGGGPAGTTAASLLTKRGWDVALLEKDVHPRFHIGESLLPMNIPIFEELGIIDKVREIGILKQGADFTPDSESTEFNTFLFSKALRKSPNHAFQVLRSEFDQLLFETCRGLGTMALEGCTATQVKLQIDRLHRVYAKTGDGEERTWECRYVLDASGQSSLIANQQKWRVRNRHHASVAVFSHYEGARLRAQEASGNISIYWFEDGWIWMIPLAGGIMSVGAVCGPEHFKRREGSREQFLETTIGQSAGAHERLRNARRIMPAQYAANYSYFSSKQTGPGFALIGDANAFVDPVFSSGVYLAMSGAKRIVPVVECWLKGDSRGYRKASRIYCRTNNRSIDLYSWFIYRFMTPAMSGLFRNPKNILGVQSAVISMLSGDVYDSWPIRIRLFLFKGIFLIAHLLHRIRERLARQTSVAAE
jgi:flavin-dependent dehydrogenase